MMSCCCSCNSTDRKRRNMKISAPISFREAPHETGHSTASKNISDFNNNGSSLRLTGSDSNNSNNITGSSSNQFHSIHSSLQSSNEEELHYAECGAPNVVDVNGNTTEYSSPRNIDGSLLGDSMHYKFVSVLTTTDSSVMGEDRDIELQLISERILTMVFPDDGSDLSYKRSLKDVSEMLERQYHDNYQIVNLSERRIDLMKLNHQVTEFGIPPHVVSPISTLITACRHTLRWLDASCHHVIVFHCKGDLSRLSTFVAAYMMFCSANARGRDNILSDRKALKDLYDSQLSVNCGPSHRRYLQYFTAVISGNLTPSEKSLQLHAITLGGLSKFFNGQAKKSGGRFFLKVYANMLLSHTSPVYTMNSPIEKIRFPIEPSLALCGDILIKCFYKRTQTAGRETLFSIQFNTSAVQVDKLFFYKQELDFACCNSKFPNSGRVDLLLRQNPAIVKEFDKSVAGGRLGVDRTQDPLIRWDSYEDFHQPEAFPAFDHIDSGGRIHGPMNHQHSQRLGAIQHTAGPVDGSPYAEVVRDTVISTSGPRVGGTRHSSPGAAQWQVSSHDSGFSSSTPGSGQPPVSAAPPAAVGLTASDARELDRLLEELRVAGETAVSSVKRTQSVRTSTAPLLNHSSTPNPISVRSAAPLSSFSSTPSQSNHQPPVQPSLSSSQPRQPPPQSYQPSSQPYQPSSQPHQPASQPYQPSSQPHQLASQPYQPSSQPYQPASQPYQPSSQPYQPASQPYQPASQPYQPTKQPSYQPPPPSSASQQQPASTPHSYRTSITRIHNDQSSVGPPRDQLGYESEPEGPSSYFRRATAFGESPTERELRLLEELKHAQEELLTLRRQQQQQQQQQSQPVRHPSQPKENEVFNIDMRYSAIHSNYGDTGTRRRHHSQQEGHYDEPRLFNSGITVRTSQLPVNGMQNPPAPSSLPSPPSYPGDRSTSDIGRHHHHHRHVHVPNGHSAHHHHHHHPIHQPDHAWEHHHHHHLREDMTALRFGNHHRPQVRSASVEPQPFPVDDSDRFFNRSGPMYDRPMDMADAGDTKLAELERSLQAASEKITRDRITSSYSAHRENLRSQSQTKTVKKEDPSGEIYEEIETVTLHPIGKGVHDLEASQNTLGRTVSGVEAPRYNYFSKRADNCAVPTAAQQASIRIGGTLPRRHTVSSNHRSSTQHTSKITRNHSFGRLTQFGTVRAGQKGLLLASGAVPGQQGQAQEHADFGNKAVVTQSMDRIHQMGGHQVWSGINNAEPSFHVQQREEQRAKTPQPKSNGATPTYRRRHLSHEYISATDALPSLEITPPSDLSSNAVPSNQSSHSGQKIPIHTVPISVNTSLGPTVSSNSNHFHSQISPPQQHLQSFQHSYQQHQDQTQHSSVVTSQGQQIHVKQVQHQAMTHQPPSHHVISAANNHHPGVANQHAMTTSGWSSAESGSDSAMNTPKFVRDTSKFWYKPSISREEAINILRDKQPGSFVVRDSNSFPGAFGLAVKVAQLPQGVSPKSDDVDSELVRHFLIEPTSKGVRLKGCSNEPVFGSLTALIYQHTLTALALPCRLVVPHSDGSHSEVDSGMVTRAGSNLGGSEQWQVLFLGTVEVESMTGSNAVVRSIDILLEEFHPGRQTTECQLKVSSDGLTLTDIKRKLFFRRHYRPNAVSFCGIDPKGRCWSGQEVKSRGLQASRIFGLITRKVGSQSSNPADNVCHVFCELQAGQPSITIVSSLNRYLHR